MINGRTARITTRNRRICFDKSPASTHRTLFGEARNITTGKRYRLTTNPRKPKDSEFITQFDVVRVTNGDKREF